MDPDMIYCMILRILVEKKFLAMPSRGKTSVSARYWSKKKLGQCYSYFSVLTPNYLRSARYLYFHSFLYQRRESIWKELGLNPGPLALQATAPVTRPRHLS